MIALISGIWLQNQTFRYLAVSSVVQVIAVPPRKKSNCPAGDARWWDLTTAWGGRGDQLNPLCWLFLPRSQVFEWSCLGRSRSISIQLSTMEWFNKHRTESKTIVTQVWRLPDMLTWLGRSTLYSIKHWCRCFCEKILQMQLNQLTWRKSIIPVGLT